METIEKVRDEVVKLVEDILAKSEEAGLDKDVEEALQAATKTLDDLTKKVEDLEKKAIDDAAAFDALETSKTELETELASKSEETEKLSEEMKALEERASKSEEELDSLKKDILLQSRMNELEELKVVRAAEAKEKQEASVREMSDEDFEAYKEEMVSLRNEFIASVQTEEPVEEPVEVPAEEAAEEVSEAEEETTEENITTPPADVDKALESANEEDVVPAPLVNAENASVARWSELSERFSEGLTKMLKKSHGTQTDNNR